MTGDSEGTEHKSRPTHAKLGHKETTERLLVNIMNRKLVELSEHVRRRMLVTGHILYIIELPTMFSSAASRNSYLRFCMNWRSFLSTHKHILTKLQSLLDSNRQGVSVNSSIRGLIMIFRVELNRKRI